MRDKQIEELTKRVERLELVQVIEHFNHLPTGTVKGRIMDALQRDLPVVMQPYRDSEGLMFLRPEAVPAKPAAAPEAEDGDPKMRPEFRRELASLLNRHCIENGSNTPDYLLADFLITCLGAYESVAQEVREKWAETFLSKTEAAVLPERRA